MNNLMCRVISPRNASISFILAIIALFLWSGATENMKDMTNIPNDLRGIKSSQDVKVRVENLIQRGVATCQSFGGELDVDELEIQTMRIGNENDQLTVIDERTFNCSTSASLYCGSGGCHVHFLSDQYTLTMRLQDWKKKSNSIHVWFHGYVCDQIGAVPCIKELNLIKGSFYVE